MKKYLVMMIAGLILLSLALISCSQIRIGYIGTNIGNEISGSYKYFNGTQTRVINTDAGDIIEIHYTSEVKKGGLSLTVVDSSPKTVANLESNTSGNIEIQAAQDKKYELIIQGSGTEGSFKVSWEISQDA
ncbi:MAG: hypothetical protein PHU23_16280 [Dehalococcoidales bacterium]|nr:hypothetical protein [Dehalococcoidales bacterium]